MVHIRVEDNQVAVFLLVSRNGSRLVFAGNFRLLDQVTDIVSVRVGNRELCAPFVRD